MIGYVTMGMAVAPMVAPTIGGVLETLLRMARLLCVPDGFRRPRPAVCVFWHLPETNHNRGSAASPRQLMHSYVSLFRSRLFWGYTLTTGFISAVFFAFFAGAPYVMIELMGRSPAEYGFYSAIVPSGYILGNFASGRFAGRVGPNRMILAGSLVATGGCRSYGGGLRDWLRAPVGPVWAHVLHWCWKRIGSAERHCRRGQREAGCRGRGGRPVGERPDRVRRARRPSRLALHSSHHGLAADHHHGRSVRCSPLPRWGLSRACARRRSADNPQSANPNLRRDRRYCETAHMRCNF